MLQTRLNCSRRGAHGQRGFTLIELMISLLLMGLIMTVVYKVFSSQDRFFRNQEQIASMQENLRATVEYINQELSWLGYQVPGIAVIKAGPSDIIFKANIPNSGSTIQYVRYQFDPSTNTIRRAAGADESFVENADLTVMASDIEAMAISYYNILNGLIITTAADPLCADELDAAVCAPGDPDDDASLLMVQRVKARVTARTSKPDWMYTDPNGGSNPNFRKRRAVLDLRARNIEDVTLQGGQIVVGSCGYLIPSVAGPYNSYAACPDKLYYTTNFGPEPDFTDNPYVTIQAFDMDGNLNTNPNQVTYVYAVAEDGTPYNMYDSADPYTVNNTILNGETRYVAANDLSNVSTGTHVELRFAYSDGLCTQVSYDGDYEITVAPSTASVFSTSATMPDGLSVDYVDNSGSPITVLATPGNVAMCSSVGNERVILGAQLIDDCGNGIPGETIAWSDGGFGGSFVNETDNGDGTYSATFVPPDSMGSVASVYTATLSAQWGSFTPNVDVDLIAAQAHDIVIDSIVDVTQAGIFQFAASVPDRATQLGGNSGSSFTIERVDGQQVMVKFHLEDACGNRAFGQGSNLTVVTSTGNLAPLTSNPDGSLSFVWESNIGCGLETLNELFTLTASSIANPSTQTETVSFNLLSTRESDPLYSPFVWIDVSPLGDRLQAGNTSDYVELQATVSQYDPIENYCTNIPGVFPVEFTVAGDTGGNGSFSFAAPFNDISETVNTSALGLAGINLYTGTGDWDDTLVVTATATIDGATYAGNASVYYHETNHPQSDSGFYQDVVYAVKIGSLQAITSFDPGDDLYLRIYDFDENEDPNAPDSFSFPYDVNVTIESQITQDVEVVGLTEYIDANSPNFLKTLETVFFPAVATTLQKGDGILQTRDGDTITMTYIDKDNPGDTDTWTINTPGADTFRIYKVGSPDEEILPPAGPLQIPVTYGDKLRPELSLPFLIDGRTGLDTVQITVDSGDDIDILVLREEGDTGIMVPDEILYGAKHFSVAQSNVPDTDNILAIPTTPRYVTLVYDVVGSYAKTLSFFMKDSDPPQVTITAPADGATVSGVVTVLVDANDVANPGGGISRIELLVNGRIINSIMGSDLSGSNPNPITWTTAIGTTPYWLDGNHVLTARAFDTSLNPAISAPVGVTVANSLSPIWFNAPAYGDILSDVADVQIEVRNLAAESGTYQLLLNVNSVPAMTWTVSASGGIFNHTVDLTDLAAFPSDGTVDLIAIIRDTGLGYYETTALDFILDRIPPDINLVSPFDLTWINAAEFPLDPQAMITDTNDVDDATVTATFSGACSSGTLSMSEMPAGSDTYTLPGLWSDPSCVDVEGVLTITVQASDVASPANSSSRAFSTGLDTKRPTVDTVDVIPMVNQSFTMGSLTFDGFIRGDVTLDATASDSNLTSGIFVGRFVNDPGAASGSPDWADFLPISPALDASSGAFASSLDTMAIDNGFFVISAGVVDAAGNSSASPPYKTLYLDNGDPWTANPAVYLPMGIARGPVYVTSNSQANVGFLEEVENRFVLQGGDPDIPAEVLHSEVFSIPAQSLARFAVDVYVMDTSTWDNGTYVGYSYATDWAGNTTRTGPSATFQVDIKRLESGSFSATFTSVGPGQFEMSATGRIVDASGSGVAGENLNLLAYRYIRACADTSCTVTSTQFNSSYSDNTQSTDGSGNFTFTAPGLIFENPVPAVHTTDIYYVYVRDTSNNLYGNMGGNLDDPPLQLNPSPPFLVSTQQSMISNLSTSLDLVGLDQRITVSGNLIRVDGQPAEYVPIRFRTYSWNTFLGSYEYNPVSPPSNYYETTTGAYGEFSYQIPTVFPTGSYDFRVYLYDDNYMSLGSLYQPSPTPGTIENHLN